MDDTKQQSHIVKLGPIKANLETPRSREEAFLEVDRELGVRVRYFPEQVERAGKLSYGDARDRLERLAEAARILADITALSEEQWAQVQAQAELARKQN